MRILIIILLLAASLSAKAYTEAELVAAVLVGEAGIDGRAGLCCVREVVATRSAQRGLTEAQVVTQRLQFSCLNGVKRADLVAKSRKHPLWAYALWLAENPVVTNYTKGATHFDSVHFRKPSWAAGLTPVAVVLHHRFYIV